MSDDYTHGDNLPDPWGDAIDKPSLLTGHPEDGEPMSDLVERLRDGDLGALDPAADEIERLRAALRVTPEFVTHDALREFVKDVLKGVEGPTKCRCGRTLDTVGRCEYHGVPEDSSWDDLMESGGLPEAQALKGDRDE